MAADGGDVAETVPIGTITTAPIEHVPTEQPKRNIDPLTGRPDPNLPHHLGWVGKFVGGGPEKAGNIAFFVIGASVLMMIVAAIAPIFTANQAMAAVMDKMITGGISLITGALGYLFGAAKNGGS